MAPRRFHGSRTVGKIMESHQAISLASGLCGRRTINRRHALVDLGIGSLGLGLIPAVLGQTDPASAPPQEGDLLVGVNDTTLKFLRPGDIVIGAPPTSRSGRN